MTFLMTLSGSMAMLSIFAAHLIGYAGIVIMLYGAFKSAWVFATNLRHEALAVSRIRIDFGSHLALGLEFLVAKDIIETLVEQSWDDLKKLAVIVALRTVVTLALGWEIRDARRELDHPNGLHPLNA